MPEELTDKSIAKMDMKQLVNSAMLVFDVPVKTEQLRLKALIEVRARELKCAPTIKSLLSAYEKEDMRLRREYASLEDETYDIQLATDGKGVPMPTMDNILKIMREDLHYSNIHYNLLTNCAEIHCNGEIVRWSDTDEAESLHYIESKYGIYADRKHADALRILFREREYNPILDIVDALEWDGVERCEEFLIKWAKVDDSAYSREVSRLIFAGGINRLYNSGCKFDDVPILIGTNQGEGKSSLVKWLAINDQYFSEVTETEGQRAIEQLEGAWICEIAELLALTKTKEQEAVKSYITRQRDKYRRPYDRQTTEYPRRCVFVGTTNNRYFLKDKTGNRRFYPVEVHSNGYDLYAHEQECRDYIIQCWAEAAHKYKQGNMPNFANQELVKEYQAAQNEAMEDDWRVGAIEQYLANKVAGDCVCVRELKREALTLGSDYAQDPTPKESQEIGVIMNRFADWNRIGLFYTADYGRQRCWRKGGTTLENAQNSDELPF